jgi:hypothetical protein
MKEPTARRPHMPGYGIVGPDEGSGLLPWSWAEERLTASHDYWAASVWPDGRPHVMPVWGVWHDGYLWFSSSVSSRKARNLLENPHCTATTDNALQPVVVNGITERITTTDLLEVFVERINEKYATDYTVGLMDTAVNACFRLAPDWVFALDEADFTGSPTRWSFDPEERT